MEISSDSLLDGKIIYQQLQNGYRTGIEPIVLAASVPARKGQTIIEAGCGAGAGLMCLAHRVAGIEGIGFDCDEDNIRLAQKNFAHNQFPQLSCFNAVLPDLPPALVSAALSGEKRFQHAFANPPWHADSGTPSPNPKKETAKRLHPGMLEKWIYCLGRLLDHQGTLSLILPAQLYLQAVRAMEQHRIGAITLFPLWPKAGREAKIVILRGRKNSAAGGRVLPGLILHTPSGGYTDEALEVLHDGKSLF